MEEVLSVYQINDILIIGFIIGMVFNMIQDLITSLMNYLNEKAWRVRDYERILYRTYEDIKYDEEDIECMGEAVINYKKRLQKRENLDKFLNKFRRKKND